MLLQFGAAALSMTATRSFDAARLLTLASFATTADAILRLRVSDHPSPFCLHYSGDADGPVTPFGFEMGPFGVEAEYLRFHCPERTGRLTQVLDYFHGIKEAVTDHMVFRWEKSADFGAGDARLLSQVCLQMGFPMDPDELPFYLSGESRELGDNYPEMPVMRDIVFFFKALMTPTSESLPELRRWRPRDAALGWKYRPGQGFETHGFARRMEVHPWKEGDSGDKGTGWRSSMGGGFLASLFGSGDKRPRCPPSGGNPSNLAGKEVNSEEDVLHLQKLPTFDGLLRPSESELLLTYLTAPYLRVPLVLKHFADPQRVRALGHKDVQGVLDACFFEPGPWQPPGSVDVPYEVPAPSRAHMATPCGLLLHELSNAPAPLVDAAEEILAMTLELDTGRHDSPCAAGLLYAVRLMTRMHCFVRYALVESGLGAEVDGVEALSDDRGGSGLSRRAESRRGRGRGPGMGGWFRRAGRAMPTRRRRASAPRRAPSAEGPGRPRPPLPSKVASQRGAGWGESSRVRHSRAPGLPPLVYPTARHHATRRADAAHGAGVHPGEPQVRGRRGGWGWE